MKNGPCSCGSGKKFKLCCGAPSRLIATPGKRALNTPAIIVLLPTRGRVTVETVTCLGKTDGLPVVMRTVSRMGVHDARNALAKMALEVPAQAPFHPQQGWFCLWVDDDAWWRTGTVYKALATLIEHKQSIGVLAGWFGPRMADSGPAVRFADGSWPRPGTDCEFGDVAEVNRCGFHFVMHPLSLLERVGENPFTLSDGDEAEDYAFCRRVREAGGRIWTHTGLPVAHIGDDGSAYLPGEPAHRVVGGELLKAEQPTKRAYGFTSGLKIADPLVVGA